MISVQIIPIDAIGMHTKTVKKRFAFGVNMRSFNKSFGEISKKLLYFSQDRIKEFSHFWCAFRIDPQEIKEWKDSIILANIDDD